MFAYVRASNPLADFFSSIENKKILIFEPSEMGCKKLTYSQFYPTFKVVHGGLFKVKKRALGGNEELKKTYAGLNLFKFQDKEQLSSSFGLGGIHDFGPRMLDKTLGGIFSQPDILGELNESASPFSYLNGRLLNMIDPTGMIADSTGGSGKLPGAPESSAQKEATPMNASQWPMYGASSSKSNDNYFPQTGFNTYPKGATNAQISKSIKSIDPQMALDVVGMTEIPILSQIAEFISAGISFAKRDYLGGSIGLGSMFPIAGKYFEGIKITKVAAKYTKLADKTHKTAATFNNTTAIHSKIMFNDITKGLAKKVINTPKGQIVKASLGNNKYIQMRNFDKSGSHTTFDFIDSNSLIFEFKFNKK